MKEDRAQSTGHKIEDKKEIEDSRRKRKEGRKEKKEMSEEEEEEEGKKRKDLADCTCVHPHSPGL